MKHTLSPILLSLLLVACGGGGGGVATTVVSPSPISQPLGLFATTPTNLVDMKSRYDQLCGSGASMQQVIPIDLNHDGKLDLLANIWCRTPTGTTNTNPVPNTLIALAQADNFTFTDKTSEIFGNINVDIGGVGIRYVKYDFNNDGYEDIVFAVNMEDGRIGSNTLVQNSAIMSKGNGQYEIVRIGSPAFTQSLTLKDNEVGGVDVVVMPSNEVLRYNNGWRVVETFNWIGWVDTVFNPRTATGRSSEVSYAQGQASTDYNYYVNTNSVWTKMGEFSLPGRYVPFISYTGDLSQTKLFTFDSKDYAIGGVVSACMNKRTPTSTPELIGLLTGREIVGGYKGEVLNEHLNYPVMTAMIALGLDSTLTFGRLPLTVNNELKNISPHRITCEDINGDGFSDIIIYRWRQGDFPVVYLNNGLGSYSLVSGTNFPSPAKGDAGQVYVDMDGDGIKDLLYYPIAGAWTDYSTVKLIVYKGQRKIGTTDLLN